MSVKVTLNRSAVKKRVMEASEKAVAVMANELLKDSNFYCREDSGELIESSQRASLPEKGLLVWDTPYAKRMYYTGEPVKDQNPNASLMWAQKAADENKQKYKRMAQASINKGV